MTNPQKAEIDAIRQRVAALEKDYLKSEVAVTLITERVQTLKDLLKEKYDVSTIEEAKLKLTMLRTDLQEEIDSINKIL